MLKKLHRNLLLLLQGFSFQSKFIDEFYRRHLGHNKIIGYEKGRPVYSLFFPALMSEEYRHAGQELLLGLMRNLRVPSLATVAVTDACDCTCDHCYFRRVKKSVPVLSLSELEGVMADCQDLGCCTIALVGGEPLLRPDLIDLISGYRTGRSALLLFTNGLHLAEMAPALRKAGLTRVMISLDYPNAQRHDSSRGVPGLFGRALSGLRRCRELGMLTGISTVRLPGTTRNDLPSFFDLCEQARVHELYINDMLTCGRVTYASPPDDEDYREVAARNEDPACKFGIFYYPHFASSAAFGCGAGATRLYVTPYGDVTPCDVHPQEFGNIRNVGLRDIWFRMSRSEGMGCVSPLGCRAEQYIRDEKSKEVPVE